MRDKVYMMSVRWYLDNDFEDIEYKYLYFDLLLSWDYIFLNYIDYTIYLL